MNTQIMQYTTRRTDAGRFVTVRDIAKRFQIPTAEAITILTSPIDGYAVSFSDETVTGNTVVTVEELGTPVDTTYVEGATLVEVAPVEETPVEETPAELPSSTSLVDALVQAEARKESELAETEPETDADADAEDYAELPAAIDAHIAPAKASRKVDECYTRYETLEVASAALGYRLVAVSELHKICDTRGYKVGRMVKALGGDRMRFTPRSAEWTPVLVGRTRYVAFSCIEDLANL